MNGQYTVYGRVISGMEHVDAIMKGEPPTAPDRMISVKVLADQKSAAKKPTAKKPTAKKPVTKKPTAKKPVTKKPAAKKLAAKKK